MASRKQYEKMWAKIILKAWKDETFKQKLLKHPNETLKEEGMKRTDLNFHIVENRGNIRYLVLPMEPKFDITENDLEKLAAGGDYIGDYWDA